jgi:penicillin amidase
MFPQVNVHLDFELHMNSYDPTSLEPTLLSPRVLRNDMAGGVSASRQSLIDQQDQRRRLFFRLLGFFTMLVVVLGVAGFLFGRHWVHRAMHDSLPQIDGTFAIAGLSAPVTVQRDAQGVPHIRAGSMDDLIVAQGYVTGQDRLWQMEALRRHAAGELAEILGPALVPHDRAQRILQIRAAADRALGALPPEQLHWLELYARGVNASIEAQRAHLPLEFRVLRFEPARWTPRDTLLVDLVMFQDLTNTFPAELDREALSARMPLTLLADLYPVGSWRDHPPAQPVVDLTAPQTNVPDVPLDETQSEVASPEHIEDLLAVRPVLAPVLSCEACVAGSNNWAVSGARTASGKPMLSNDMHLAHGVPGIWYQVDLEAPVSGGEFHVAGVSLPGAPFVIVGHNEHLAWGFTNLGATVQDVAVEHARGAGAAAEYEAEAGNWKPLLHQREMIRVKGERDAVLDVTSAQHDGVATPIISGIFPNEKRVLSLHWTIYDPANITDPFLAIDSATDWPSLHAAFSTFGGPAQNLVFADDQGHIGYHAVGRVPVRGSMTQPSAISPVPSDALDAGQRWVGYIPFDQLPQSFDPPNGVLATANARVTPDGYAFPITLNWAAPYRNERIWKVLTARDHLTAKDMLALQTDVYSDVDHVIAQRVAYAIDHASVSQDKIAAKRLHQAADLLREWDGDVDADAAAPAIVDATRAALWPMLIDPQFKAEADAKAMDASQLYSWGGKAYAQEWLIMHTPSRWLSGKYSNWDDLLADAVAKGLIEAHAPMDLKKWHYGEANPVDIEHPIFSQSALLRLLIGVPIGTGVQPQSGDGTTVKQVGKSFGASERFTADLSDLDHSTLNVVLGQSGDPASPWFMNQWNAWYRGTTFLMPFTKAAVDAATIHTLTLTPK